MKLSTPIQYVMSATLAAMAFSGCQSTSDPSETFQLGSATAASGGTFEPAKLNIPVAQLSANGSADFSALLVDQDLAPIFLTSAASGDQAVLDGPDSEPGELSQSLSASDLTVAATSECEQLGLATLEITPLVNEAIAEIRGTYTDKGCGTRDTLTVSVRSSKTGRVSSAYGFIDVSPTSVESIQIINMGPDSLRLKGLSPDSTEIQVRAYEPGGETPATNRQVSVSITSKDFGAKLSGTNLVTNQAGIAVTKLDAGTVAQSVRVTASIVDPVTGLTRSSQTDPIQISSGIPSQSGMSLGTTCFNLEGANIEGNTSRIQIQARDASSGNAVDGQIISFVTNAGAVVPSTCTLVDGVCSVDFRTQDPRAESGVAQILATTQGEESFSDLNGNGLRDPNEPFEDIGEAFNDLNGNSIRDENENFVDTNNNGQYDGPNGFFDGYTCSGDSCSLNAATVYDDIRITMSTAQAQISLTGRKGIDDFRGSAMILDPNATAELTFKIRDTNGNLMGDGTRIELRKVSENGAYIVVNTGPATQTCGPSRTDVYNFSVTASSIPANIGANEFASTNLELTVTSPSGVVSAFPLQIESPENGGKPTVSFTANPLIADVGETVNVNYNGIRADECTSDWGQDLGTSGSRRLTFSSAGFEVITIECTNDQGSTTRSIELDIRDPVHPAPTATISVDNAAVTQGDPVKITYGSSAAESCDGNFGSNLGTSGTRTVRADNVGFQLYTVTCSGLGGDAYAEVEVQVQSNTGNLAAPSVNLMASASLIQAGDLLTLSYTATDAATCSSNFGSGLQPTGDSRDLRPTTTGISDYSVTCTNGNGSSTSVVQVEVVDQGPLSLTFSVDKGRVLEGDLLTFTYSAPDADECVTSGDNTQWAQQLATSGTVSYRIPSDGSMLNYQNFGIRCTRDLDNAEAYSEAEVFVEAVGVPVITLTATPGVITAGETVRVIYESQQPVSCQSNGWTTDLTDGYALEDIVLNAPGTEDFIISCTNLTGTTTESTTVTVN